MADLAEQAARLCKADLVTEMVGEFPELQGIMGGYYARAEGLPDEVADAIRDHYKPVGQGDEVPTAPVTVAVSLADKLDTLYCFFARDMRPTGSKDPFALRRAGLAIIELIFKNHIRGTITKFVRGCTEFRCLQLFDLAFNRDDKVAEFTEGLYEAHDRDAFLDETLSHLERLNSLTEVRVKADYDKQAFQWVYEGVVLSDRERHYANEIGQFLADRLKVQQREAGVRHDLIDAVFALGGEDDLVRLLARVKALQGFVAGEDGADLLVAYRRAANILRKENYQPNPAPPERSRGTMPSASEAATARVLAPLELVPRLRSGGTEKG